MTFQLVHLGHGEIAIHESPDFVDPSISLPKAPQRPNKTRQIASERLDLLREVLKTEGSERPRFRPVTLLKARPEQCRYISPEETSVCCGKKVTNRGSSWCEVHQNIVFVSRHLPCGNPVDSGHKTRIFSVR